MAETGTNDRAHIADLLSRAEADTAEYWEGPTSTVARVAGNLRAAVTGNPDNDPIRNETVEL